MQKKIFPGPIPIIAENPQGQEKDLSRPLSISADNTQGSQEELPDAFDFGSPVLIDSFQQASPLQTALPESQGSPSV